jgi:hypothetical protein
MQWIVIRKLSVKRLDDQGSKDNAKNSFSEVGRKNS